MTLILSLATPHFAIQVADRLVTFLRDGSVKNSAAMKIVQYCNKMLFGFTGLAELDGKTTDKWLADVICNCPKRSLDTLTQLLIEKAGEACRRLHWSWVAPERRHLAFLGVGYTRCSNDGSLNPTIIRVSNFHGRDGNPTGVNSAFTLQHRVFRPTSGATWGVISTGAARTSAEASRLTRLLLRCAKKSVGPKEALRLLSEAIREVAERQAAESIPSMKNKNPPKPTVGKDLVVGLIPRVAAEGDQIRLMTADRAFGAFLGPISGSMSFNPHETPVFLNMPEGNGLGFLDAPILACPGMGHAALTVGRKPQSN